MKNTTQNSHQLETTKPNSQHHQHPELSDEELLLVVGGGIETKTTLDLESNSVVLDFYENAFFEKFK